MGFWSRTGDRLDRAMCRQEAREADQAARRAARRGDAKAAADHRAYAERMRRVAKGGK